PDAGGYATVDRHLTTTGTAAPRAAALGYRALGTAPDRHPAHGAWTRPCRFRARSELRVPYAGNDRPQSPRAGSRSQGAARARRSPPFGGPSPLLHERPA